MVKLENHLRNSDYTFVIIQNGKEIHRTTGTAEVGGEYEQYKFAEDQTGPTIIRFENIKNTGQETEFGIVVAPEFGTITVIILFSALLVSCFNIKTLLCKKSNSKLILQSY